MSKSRSLIGIAAAAIVLLGTFACSAETAQPSASGTAVLAGDLQLEAWIKCATSKAKQFGRSANPAHDAHLILGECATYQFNYMSSLNQEGDSNHEVYVKEMEVESTLLKTLQDILSQSK